MHTVIVGGGFAGVKAALELSKKNIGKVTLVSNEPYFLHHATLYATATGRAKQESVASLKDIFETHANVTVVHDSMKSIDVTRQLVIGDRKSYKYDNLIIAIGMVTTFFNIEGMAAHSFGIKTLDEVREFKQHLHEELSTDRHLDKNYVIVGAGPTGVELAGALKVYLERIARAHHIKRARAHVTLVEAAPRILPRSSKTASRKVQKRLEDMGIKVLTNHKVNALDDDYILIDGKKTPTKTVVWTSGVANHPFFSKHTDIFELSPNGRVVVDEHLQAHDNIYVIGDNAATKNSGLAWTALSNAKFVADHLARKYSDRHLPAAPDKAPPSGIPVGESWAYVEWKGMYLAGRFGHYARRMIELYGYNALLPYSESIVAWRAHNIFEEDCTLCKTA